MKNFGYIITEIREDDRQVINNILIEQWESTNITIRGKIVDGTKLNGFIAKINDKLVGLITYLIEEGECEICTLNSFIENKGIGSSLIEKVKFVAKENNCSRLKLVTTNDNIRGIEFYQRRGFNFANLYKDSISKARLLKPEIPMYADNGLPIKDEIEFEIIL